MLQYSFLSVINNIYNFEASLMYKL